MGKLVDETGKRYGRLLVLRRGGSDRGRNAMWLCRCDCGAEARVLGGSLRSGDTRSCGCLRRERVTTHGKADLPEHSVWEGMLQRCENPNDPDFRHYGGRSIKVCKSWHDFTNFYADMGPRPGVGYSIDRINNAGNYEPGNCRWASREQQMRNTRAQKRPSVGVYKTSSGRFEAGIRANGKQHYLGTFDTVEEARAARRGGEMLHWGRMPDLSFLGAL